jgi:hypothetical protein
MLYPKRPLRTVIAMLAAAVLAATTACTATPLAGQASQAAEAGPVASVTASPALGDTSLSPTEPVSIWVDRGTITALTVTSPAGAQVSGTLSADKKSWTLDEPLGYGKTYTVSGTATGTDGKAVPIAGSYTTVTPTDKLTSQISPGDDVVVGVAAPVIIRFGSAPADKATVEQHVSITTTPHVDGAWAWITHDGDTWPSLDWRPQEYWPAGTVVHVESDLYGLEIGGGQYGGDTVTSDFTIGRNQVVKADANSHQMVVQQDGVTVATYDASSAAATSSATPTGSPAPASTS